MRYFLWWRIWETPPQGEMGPMAIRSITQGEFHQVIPRRPPRGTVTGEEVAWVADESGKIMGTVAAKRGDSHWCYILWKRVKGSGFRVCEIRDTFESHQEAELQLLAVMASTEKPALDSRPENASVPQPLGR